MLIKYLLKLDVLHSIYGPRNVYKYLYIYMKMLLDVTLVEFHICNIQCIIYSTLLSLK